MEGPSAPTFAVVVPTYNRARFIGATIESILSQSYAPAEVIVVDDGSTDDTESVLRPYLSRLRYIKAEQGGVQRARNRGIAAATATWVALCDSDDLWAPPYLETAAAFISRHPALNLVFSN